MHFRAAIILVTGAVVADDALAQVRVGGTYTCPSTRAVVEACDGNYCTVQMLNPYAPDGKGAKIEITQATADQHFAGCTVEGGTPIATATVPASRPPVGAEDSAPVTPRPPTPGVDYRVGYGAGVRFPAQAAEPTPAGRLVPNGYACSGFIGVPPNGHMVPMPGFTIAANGTYRHQHGSTGTVTVAGDKLLFHGGALDGQAASFDAGPTGHGTVHLFNEARTRTVIDCDGKS